MFKRTVVFWSATGMLLTMIYSGAAVGVQTGNVQTLMALSGFDDQLEVLPNAVRNSFHELMVNDGVVAPFEPVDIPKMKKAVADVFETDALRHTVVEELRSSMSVNELDRLIQFYSSERGIAMRQSELENSILEHSDRFQEWHQQTGMYGLDRERQNVIRDLEHAMQATSGAVDAMIGMQVAMQVSLTPVLPTTEQMTASQLLLAAQEQRPELTRIYRKSSLETLAFVFREQSTESLSAYAAILSSEAGRRYIEAVNDGLTKGLFNAAEKLGVSLQEILHGRIGQGA